MKTTGNGAIVQVEKDKSRYNCRKWRLHVSCGRDFRTGRYIQKTRRVTGTYTQAKEALHEFIAELSTQDYHGQMKQSYTLEEYSAYFLDLRTKSNDVSKSTLRKNSYHYAKINSRLGNAKLHELTPMLLEDTFLELRGECSSTYLRGVYQSLKCMLDHAVKTKVLPENPLSGVDMPRSDTLEKEVIDKETLIAFVASLDVTNRTEIAMYLIAVYGLRRMEPTCIRWSDIDFSEMLLRIPQSKTDSGVRMLPLDEQTYRALKRRKARVENDLKLIGLELDNDALICADADGKGISPQCITAWWNKHKDEYGMGKFTPHSFRHTFSTNLAKAHVHPSVMANLLGHSSTAVSMEVYTHMDTSEKKKALDNLHDYLVLQ